MKTNWFVPSKVKTISWLVPHKFYVILLHNSIQCRIYIGSFFHQEHNLVTVHLPTKPPVFNLNFFFFFRSFCLCCIYIELYKFKKEMIFVEPTTDVIQYSRRYQAQLMECTNSIFSYQVNYARIKENQEFQIFMLNTRRKLNLS